MKTIIIGAGEVGRSLCRVLQEKHEVFLRDVQEENVEGEVDVMNICFPYFRIFEDEVRRYQKLYKPKLTIIHSTVPVGTSRKLGAVHSPIHGRHPNLAKGILTFTKYIGGARPKDTALARKFLNQAGIKTKVVSSPEASELSKILCTTYYGFAILFMKETKRICGKLGISFSEVYNWNQHYNRGYAKLGLHSVIRPILKYKDGPIGGHCVVPNTKLLNSWLTNTLRKRAVTYNP